MIGTFTIQLDENHVFCLVQLALDKQHMSVSWHWDHKPTPDETQTINGRAEPIFRDALMRLQLAEAAYLN